MLLRTVLISLFSLSAVLSPSPAWSALDSPVWVAPDPVACTGYPEPRVFVDVQSWWQNDPARGLNGTNEGHAHLGACIPERQTLSAPTVIDVRFTMHENPGRANYVSMVVKGTDYETTVQKLSLDGMTCPVGTCEKWLQFTLDPSTFEQSGLQEVRFRAFVPERAVDGSAREMRDSMNFQLYVANGRSRADVSRHPYLRGKGWYTHAEYCEAALLTTPLPKGPVSGTWSPRVQMVDHGSDDLPVTRHVVTLDPDFHHGLPGTVLRAGTGQLPATDLSIDTTTLTNGRHTLHLRADCDDTTLGSVNSGVVAVKFDVRN